ncbi:hypothetical protein Ae717Ps2_6579c [Pseudonocardia sp. Ae717_Ps2]|nr:hypothetical protein Ae717Ps2_6579c [Pseudonocardia sp. Ae717_Ps2]
MRPRGLSMRGGDPECDRDPGRLRRQGDVAAQRRLQVVEQDGPVRARVGAAGRCQGVVSVLVPVSAPRC